MAGIGGTRQLPSFGDPLCNTNLGSQVSRYQGGFEQQQGFDIVDDEPRVCGRKIGKKRNAGRAVNLKPMGIL